MSKPTNTRQEEPKEPEYAKGTDFELEARRDEAEDLRLEARRDGVKDIEREAQIEELESSGDLVQKYPTDKKGPLVGGGWNTSDRVKITSAPTEKAWYAKSPKAQRTELEKIMGTHRPTGGHKARSTPCKAVDLVRPGTLKDKHESEKVRRRDAEADILITVADRAMKPALPSPPPPPEPAVIGYCRECYGPIPRHMRADAKFCCEAHSKAFRRREADRDTLDRAFKDYRARTPEAPYIPYHYPPPPPVPTIPMSAMFAARNHRVAEYLATR